MHLEEQIAKKQMEIEMEAAKKQAERAELERKMAMDRADAVRRSQQNSSILDLPSYWLSGGEPSRIVQNAYSKGGYNTSNAASMLNESVHKTCQCTQNDCWDRVVQNPFKGCSVAPL